MNYDYTNFLAAKAVTDAADGLRDILPVNPILFDFQAAIVKWALRRGRAAIFADCGMGKTFMQLEWARQVPGRVLILAPLAVAKQTMREGKKLGMELDYSRDGQSKAQIVITNYEMMHHFDAGDFTGIVLDESSILKSFTGSTRNEVIDRFGKLRFRLCCTATPSPNDYVELGNHAEFLGAMSRTQMLSMFFVHDGGETQKWRLKGHAESEFWKWLCSWAVMIRKPSDLGFDDKGFNLPEIKLHNVIVDSGQPISGMLFAMHAETLQERIRARRETTIDRVGACAAIIARQWTNKQNANITEPIASPIGTELKHGASNGMPKISSVNALGRGSINRALALSRSTLPSELTANPTVSTCEPICESGIRKNAPKLYPTTENAGKKGRKSSRIGILKTNTELHSSNTMPCTNPKADAARYANGHQQSGSPLTTVTPQERSGDCFARHAIPDSDTLRTIPLGSNEQWIIWCNLNDEAAKAHKAIPGSINIQGSDTREVKEQAVLDFIEGRIRVLISKVSIFGFGLNLQCCHNVVFLGLSDSYEAYYQALRRVYRYGQKLPVNVYIICAEIEGNVVAGIRRKEADAARMADEMVKHMHDLNTENIRGVQHSLTSYNPQTKIQLPAFL